MRRHRISLALAAAIALAGGCSAPPPSSASVASVAALPPTIASSAGPVELTVDGAASLKSVLDASKAAWESSHPGSTLTISTDSSAALETQIEQGAPADVFLSADTTNARKLVDASLSDGPARDFAGNVLTIVVPVANPAGIRTPADRARHGVKIIAAGDGVPVTKYAQQVVTKLASLDGYPSGFAAACASNVVSREDNVKAVVAKIELGEGDAGIVYATDAKASTKVSTIAIPDSANVPATYAGVVVKGSTHTPTAHAFLDWLAGSDGQAILKDFGFLP